MYSLNEYQKYDCTPLLSDLQHNPEILIIPPKFYLYYVLKICKKLITKNITTGNRTFRISNIPCERPKF